MKTGFTIIARDAPSFTAGRDSASPIGRYRFDVVDIVFLCEYNRQYENRTANQITPG